MNLIELVAANDEFFVMSFEDMCDHLRLDPGTPCVPAKTYARVPCSRIIRGSGCIEQPHDRGDVPVIMKGAWFAMAESAGTYRGFRDAVVERFMRRYKLTILSMREARKIHDHIHSLFKKPKRKRSVYFWSNKMMHDSDFYGDRWGETLCFINGEKMFLDKPQILYCKSILRQQRKLEKVIGHTGGPKWQKLIQQVI